MDGMDRALAGLRQEDLIRQTQRRQQVRDAGAGRGAWAPFGLPRDLWLVALGIFVNYLGYGGVLPFEVIYLHDGRGFSVGVAGVVVSLITGVAVVTAAPAGPLIDRFGPRAVAAAAAVALAAGYTGLAFAQSPGVAVVAAVIAGMGNGALNPSQSALVTTLSPPRLRHRATAVARVAANVGAGLGGAVGGLVAAYGLTGFIGLLLANAVTYLAFVGLLLAVVREGERPQPLPGGYRLVVRDRAFVRLAGVNVAVIAVGWGAFTWLVPPYAGTQLRVSAPLIGLLLLANAATVAIVQLPIARLAEGHRRVATMALAAATFVVACLLVVAAGAGGPIGYPALLAATILVGVGECLHTTVLMPLTADLAPAGLGGRYMASMGLSWWIGLALAPALGAPFLDRSASVVFLAAAGIALAAGVVAVRLDHLLPATARLTPLATGEG
jgi:MFS family permease